MRGEQVCKAVNRGLIQPGEWLIKQPQCLIRTTGQRQRHAARLTLAEEPDWFIDEGVQLKTLHGAGIGRQAAAGEELQVFPRAEVGQQAVQMPEVAGRLLRQAFD